MGARKLVFISFCKYRRRSDALKDMVAQDSLFQALRGVRIPFLTIQFSTGVKSNICEHKTGMEFFDENFECCSAIRKRKQDLISRNNGPGVHGFVL